MTDTNISIDISSPAPRTVDRAARSRRSRATRLGRAARLVVSVVTAVLVPAMSYVAASADLAMHRQWIHYPTNIAKSGYVVTNVGCARARSARGLDAMFRDRVGPVLGLDNAHVIDLGGERYLWLFNDLFFDYTNSNSSLIGSTFVRNGAMLEEQGCFTLVRRGDARRILPFERGNLPTDADEVQELFFWPLGGESHGNRIYVVWAEMHTDRTANWSPQDGINCHPVRTWLGTYDARTLARLDFRPAPNDGVFPQYGFAVASDERHTYLFGNSNLLNFSLEGGFFGGPHSATKMYLARVPRGRLGADPEYRTARGWSRDADDAVPISERFVTENQMQPRYLDGRWVSVTKVNGFAGSDTIVEVAKRPWGPWRIVSRRKVEPFRGFDVMSTYQPVILPYRDRAGDLIVVVSQNAHNWPEAAKDPSMYRLRAYAEPWPSGGEALSALRG